MSEVPSSANAVSAALPYGFEDGHEQDAQGEADQ